VSFKTSESIKELASALAKAQGEIGHAAKDRTNPAFKARYADLASVIDACRDALAANSLAVMQPVSVAPGVVSVTTRLVHASGEWAECTIDIAPSDMRAHAIGSAITYGRRYGLSSMVGVAPDDDDGNAASSHPKQWPDEIANALAAIGRDFPERHAEAISAAATGGIAALRRIYADAKSAPKLVEMARPIEATDEKAGE